MRQVNWLQAWNHHFNHLLPYGPCDPYARLVDVRVLRAWPLKCDPQAQDIQAQPHPSDPILIKVPRSGSDQ